MSHRFIVYLAVGATVGTLGICAQSIIVRLLPEGDFWYGLSIALIYPPCTILSFVFHKYLTFDRSEIARHAFAIYVVMTCFSAFFASVLATALRITLIYFGFKAGLASFLAFILAAIVTAIITYKVNAMIVFGKSVQNE
jgi:putative flippase GtrA